MSDKGTIKQMTKDIDGLIQYVELLVSGNSKASTTGGPLGNKFFLQTGAKCRATDKCSDKNDPSTCESTNRYIYVNNVPEGNIPFISNGLGVNFTEFKGLIPGAMGNLNVLNPFAIMGAFMSGSTPPCQEITLETVDVNNNKSSETHYVTLVDISNMDPCSLPGNVNPVSGAKCKETFVSNSNSNTNTFKKVLQKNDHSYEVLMPDDPMDQIYFASLAGIGIYILYSCMQKSG
jgi:hypothetical protein